MTPRVSKLQICVLMFVHAFAIALYLVPLPGVLKAHGLEDYVIYVFCIASAASFVSPMIFGSLADRKFPPERLLGVVTLGGAVLLCAVYSAIHFHWSPRTYLSLVVCYHLWAAPGWGLLTSIGLMHLERPEKEFPPLRVWATIGFMLGAACVSFVLKADRSPLCGFAAAAVFVGECLFCFSLPPSRPPPTAAPRRLRDYLGWDALRLMADRDHRMIFLTTALFSIPLAAFYPFTNRHLNSLDVESVSGWMSLAQFSEIAGMIGLAIIMGRFRMKWLMLAALLLGVVRYVLYATNDFAAIVVGISLHGLVYTLFFMTTQIYMEKRVSSSLRNQAQALLLLMANGVGSLSGYLLSEWWYRQCLAGGHADWPRFWWPLAAAVAGVAVVFALGYRGAGRPLKEAGSE
ncbi:MAG: MFS transporter [Verrucomicrobiales bacterium]|nr:MFS transporter [Verrucomicrobiales bacterium]